MTIMFSKFETSDWVLLGVGVLGTAWVLSTVCDRQFVPTVIKNAISCPTDHLLPLRASDLAPTPH